MTFVFDTFTIENPRAYVIGQETNTPVEFDSNSFNELLTKLNEAHANDEYLFSSLKVTLIDESLVSIEFVDSDTGELYSEEAHYQKLSNPDRLEIDGSTFSSWEIANDCVRLSSWGDFRTARLDTMEQNIIGFNYLPELVLDEEYIGELYSGFVNDTILIVDINDTFCPE